MKKSKYKSINIKYHQYLKKVRKKRKYKENFQIIINYK